jgi:hypothetical protein
LRLVEGTLGIGGARCSCHPSNPSHLSGGRHWEAFLTGARHRDWPSRALK